MPVVPPQVDGYGLAGGPVLRLGVQPRLVRLQTVDMVWCGNMVLYRVWCICYGMGAHLMRLLSVHMVWYMVIWYDGIVLNYSEYTSCEDNV